MRMSRTWTQTIRWQISEAPRTRKQRRSDSTSSRPNWSRRATNGVVACAVSSTTLAFLSALPVTRRIQILCRRGSLHRRGLQRQQSNSALVRRRRSRARVLRKIRAHHRRKRAMLASLLSSLALQGALVLPLPLPSAPLVPLPSATLQPLSLAPPTQALHSSSGLP
jgi:hypothetical protein